MVIVAASAPGHRGAGDRLFAARAPDSAVRTNFRTERIEASGADICVGERTLFGCYSASVDLQKESADWF